MKKKIFNLLLVLLSVVSLFACKKDPEIESFIVDETTIPEIQEGEIDAKLGQIKLKVTLTDGSSELVNLTKSMISTSDYAKLSNAGTYTITANYEGFSDQFSITIYSAVNNNYTVQVLYPDNTPVTSGVLVQWCSGNNCFLPVGVDANGYAEIELDDGSYYIHIEGIPQGYTYDPNAYTTNTENKHVEIKLLAKSSIASGDGSSYNPFILEKGVYELTFEQAGNKGMKYFSFTPEKSGEYSITSIAMDKLALNVIDPYIAFGENFDDSGNIEGNINFNHIFTAEAGVTYTFVILVSSATSFPANFEIVVSEK